MSLTYEELKNMKIGEVYYESSQYANIKFTVKSKPIEKQNKDLTQLTWIGSVKDQEDIDYLITKGLEHYGPKIYKFPAYVGVEQWGY